MGHAQAAHATSSIETAPSVPLPFELSRLHRPNTQLKLGRMGFNATETARYAQLIEKLIWSKRRPPLHLRDKIREGQRIEGNIIDLFFIRPLFRRPGETVESSIARTRFIRSRKVWRVYWKRADGKWHVYRPRPEVRSFAKFLKLVEEDVNGCFWG